LSLCVVGRSQTKWRMTVHCYVEDILIIYDSLNTDILSVLNEFHKIQQLNFTMECETNNTIHYLDLTIHRQSNKAIRNI
jgi:hypothetical protein